ncbi:hypothetical protein [Thalassobellus citreus]|uniref:hypothetical protein n=1 Tax=Thalassobellus citreus TaxID=3367752 RepID=UPI0037A54BF7
MKIVSSILSLFLIAIILFNSLRVSFTYAYYLVDTADFIERLCENKDKPIMQCNGKCHLKKVAQNNSTNDDKVPLKEIDFKEVILYIVAETAFNFTYTTASENEISNYNNLYTYSLISTLDHPPQSLFSHNKI